MSQQVRLTLDEAIAQLSILEDQIERLKTLLADTELKIASLSMLEDSLQSLKDGADDALVSIDNSGIIYAQASVKKLDKVIVHAGLDVYVEVPHEKAVEIVKSMRAEYSKLAEVYRQELQRLTQYYEGLRAAVEQAVARAREVQKQAQSR